MLYKEKAIPLIEKLNTYEYNLSLTDGYKNKVVILFTLSNKTDEEYFYAEIEDSDEYAKITDYIKTKVNLEQFSFTLTDYKETDRFLTINV